MVEQPATQPLIKGKAGWAELRRYLRPAVAFDVDAHPGDHGWFGPESETWKLFAQRSTFPAAIRAAWLQALHPSVLEAVVGAGGFAADPNRRVLATVNWINQVVFGSTSEAVAACETVNRVHARIEGRREDGVWYRADDPWLQRWVHCTLVDSLRVCHRTFARSPQLDEDRLVAEWAGAAQALGVTRIPLDARALDEALDEHVGELVLDERARRMAASVGAFEFPFPASLLLRSVAPAVATTLPNRWRSLVEAGDNRDVKACKMLLCIAGSQPHPLIAAARRRCDDQLEKVTAPAPVR